VITAILLAAGESRRMGRPKPLLDWNGETLIEYQIDQLRKGGVDEVIAVLGHAARKVRPLAERAGATAVINVDYAEGRASSLRTGAFAIPSGTSEIIVLNIDQPRPAGVIRRLLENHLSTGALITLPTFEGQRGHPALLCGSLGPELKRVDEATKGLREIIHRRAGDVHELPFDSGIVLLDINTPEDYARARETFAEVHP
jgi:molybdenum cofactor cytidylyltransferase